MIVLIKIISLLICLISLFSGGRAPVYGPPGPISSNPVCEYVYTNNTFEETAREHVEWRFTDSKCHLDECLYVNVLPYNTNVIWTFSQPFMEEDEIFIALVDDYGTLLYVLRGTPLPDGNVLFDFSLVDGGTYYLFEFSNVDI